MKNSLGKTMFAVFAAFAVAIVLGLTGPTAFAATSPILTGSSTYSVLGATTVTNTGATTTTGEVGVSTGTAITNFPPGIAAGDNSIHLHSNDASAIAAQADNLVAFGALDQPCDFTYPDLQDLTLLSPLAPGVYCSLGSFRLTGNLALTGTTGVWIFKSATSLITSSGSSVTGGDPCNVWWRVGSSATLGTTTDFIGNILALTSISMATGATLDGRAMVQTGAVTLDANIISGPICTPVTGTLNVIKTVTNDNGGTAVPADANVHVQVGVVPADVVGSPQVGAGAPGTTYTLAPDTYTVLEDPLAGYTITYSGDCNASGVVTVTAGSTLLCTVNNNDIAPVVPPAPPAAGGGGSYTPATVPPIISVIKVPNPLLLPDGEGQVTYTYTLNNVGTVPVNDITMVDDSCSPLNLISGDINSNSILEVDETWTYRCTTTLTETHTNIVTAKGWANGIQATDIARATVTVGQPPIIPPLNINLKKQKD